MRFVFSVLVLLFAPFSQAIEYYSTSAAMSAALTQAVSACSNWHTSDLTPPAGCLRYIVATCKVPEPWYRVGEVAYCPTAPGGSSDCYLSGTKWVCEVGRSAGVAASTAARKKGFSADAQNAAFGPAKDAYAACIAAAKPVEECQRKAADVGYLAAVKYTQDSERGSLMSKALLAGLLGTSLAAAGVAAVVAAGTLAAPIALTVAAHAGIGLAISSLSENGRVYEPRSAVTSSEQRPVLNVRLNESVPAIANVPEVQVVDKKFVPGGGSFGTSGASGSWSTGASGSWEYSDTAGNKAVVAADGKSVELYKAGSNVVSESARIVDYQSPEGVTESAVAAHTAAQVQTDAGSVVAGITRVYSINGEEKVAPVVTVTPVLGTSSTISENNVIVSGNPGGQTIAEQAAVLPQTVYTGGSTVVGSGSGCGTADNPCVADVKTPGSDYQAGEFSTDKLTEANNSIKSMLNNIGLGKNPDGTGISGFGEGFSKLLGFQVGGGGCSSPSVQIFGTTLTFPYWCEMADMIRTFAEFALWFLMVWRLLVIAARSNATT